METQCTSTQLISVGSTGTNTEIVYTGTVRPIPFVNKGEYIMADVDTHYLANQHSDIRREAAEHTNEIVREGMKGDFTTQKAITDNLAQTSNQIDAFEDVMNNQLFALGRESADNRAQIMALGFQVRDGFNAAAKDSEINGLKTQIEIAKQGTYLSDKIDAGNLKTVELLNSLKESDLNRMLIERNAALVEAAADGRYWRHRHHGDQFQGQWAALNSQLQAFQSQLQETRQGMVNFGTMAGVGQTSTSNNVR